MRSLPKTWLDEAISNGLPTSDPNKPSEIRTVGTACGHPRGAQWAVAVMVGAVDVAYLRFYRFTWVAGDAADALLFDDKEKASYAARRFMWLSGGEAQLEEIGCADCFRLRAPVPHEV